mgnify:CR=1 FL=1
MEGEEEVLDAAISAYRLARERAKLARRLDGRECVKRLAKQWPESYSSNGPGGFVLFCGKSADEILEEWVKVRHPREPVGGREWSRLAAIVIWRGEREVEEATK